MDKHYTLFFEEIDKKDLPLVGGKGANLGELTKAGFPVPGGFCVATGAYNDFLTHNDLVAFIVQALEGASLIIFGKLAKDLESD